MLSADSEGYASSSKQGYTIPERTPQQGIGPTASGAAADVLRRAMGGAAGQMQVHAAGPAPAPQETTWQKHKWLIVGGSVLGLAALIVGVSVLRAPRKAEAT